MNIVPMRSFILTFFSILIFSSSALKAKTKWYNHPRTAVSGKTKLLASYGSWWPKTCVGKSVDIKILKKPKYGKISVKIENDKINRNFSGKKSKCTGVSIPSLNLYYKSKSGFKGIDIVKSRFQAENSSTVRFITYVIRVK